MNKLLIFALLTACVFAGFQSAEDSQIAAAFKNFTETYHKKYDSEEHYNARFSIFKENYKKIQLLNKDSQVSYKINSFADQSTEEFSQTYGIQQSKLKKVQQKRKSASTTFSASATAASASSIPVNKDWTTLGAVTSVKDRGMCGSDWAFPAVEAIEGQYFLQKQQSLISFSAQQLVDCSISNLGCDGGLMDYAYQDLATLKLQSAETYPYFGVTQACNYNISLGLVNVSSYVEVQDTPQKIKEALANVGPLSAILFGGDIYYQFYEAGIIDYDCGFHDFAVGVLAVGYGQDYVTGKLYWKAKNAFGPSWGENGYFRISQDLGHCGIHMATYPILA